jgi:hypothetical protein
MGWMRISIRFHKWWKTWYTRRDGPMARATSSVKTGCALAIFAMMVFSATAARADDANKWTGTPSYNVGSLHPSMTLEPDTDRPGANLRVFNLDTAYPQRCAKACQEDAKCRAYTYVKPGVQGPKARCWLKTSVPPAKSSACCVSGVKTVQGGEAHPTKVPVLEGRPLPTGPISLEQDTDRPGLNYRSFDLDVPEPKRCQRTCQDDPECKAWTYVKPGVQGPRARCWLKTGVPAAKPNPCCLSGVKTAETAQSQPSVPVQTMPGTMEASPKPQADTTKAPASMSQSAVRPKMWKGMKVKIPPASGRQPVRPLNRGELVNLIMKNPRTAPRMNQLASTMGMPAQQMATQSTSGKVVTGSPATNPPSGMTKNWDWEAGVRFTPRSTEGDLQVWGIVIWEKEGFGLSDFYQRDELFLYGDSEDVGIGFSINTPPGDYVITVEFEAMYLGDKDDLIYDCSGCTWNTALIPVVDKKYFTEGHIFTYIGQFRVEHSNALTHSIQIPSSGVVGISSGVFRGITFTRL